MQLVIVSVKDAAAQAFGRPVFVHTQGLAVRSFRDEINRKAADNEMYKHPEDYDLYVVGSFDDASGLLTARKPELIIRGKDCHVSE